MFSVNPKKCAQFSHKKLFEKVERTVGIPKITLPRLDPLGEVSSKNFKFSARVFNFPFLGNTI